MTTGRINQVTIFQLDVFLPLFSKERKKSAPHLVYLAFEKCIFYWQIVMSEFSPPWKKKKKKINLFFLSPCWLQLDSCCKSTEGYYLQRWDLLQNSLAVRYTTSFDAGWKKH